MTVLLFRDDAYLTSCKAKVIAVTPEGGIVLDRTLFYAASGGQPGDVGALILGHRRVPVTSTSYAPDRTTVVHAVPADEPAIGVGDEVEASLDWGVRYARMRAHTALHLLSVALPYPVTGGAIGEGEGRLDFDIPDAGLDRDEITARLQGMVAQDAALSERWITEEELDANHGLVKTMSVKPPRGSGRVRLVEIEGLDLQPCGGTHVRRTSEIGGVTVTAIEKKGRQNRRVRIALS